MHYGGVSGTLKGNAEDQYLMVKTSCCPVGRLSPISFSANIMEKIEARISGVTEIGNYVVYDMDIRLNFQKFKFKEFQVSKRFSDFITFRRTLLGLGYAYIPELPSRYTSFLKNKEKNVDERKKSLINFTNYVLNDNDLRTHDEVLTFYHIPRSDINELKSGEKVHVYDKKLEIDSALKWIEVHKNVKSNIQNVRIRVNVNSSNNLGDSKKLLKSCENDIKNLQEYLKHSVELSVEEIKRRNQLLNSLITEITDLTSMIDHIMKPSSSSSNLNADTTYSSVSSKSISRRTFGKPVETEDTRKLSNSQFLKTQQLQMESQDHDLEELRQIITRQKQLGIAVNEELGIQNELLGGLDKQVDYSSDRMNLAKSKIKRFT